MKHMKIFISGPMRGLPNYNFDKFDLVEKWLIAAGYDVVNPAHISRSYKESTILSNKDKFNEMVMRQLSALEKCDAILVLDDWEKSDGVKTEIQHALKHNLLVIFEKTGLKFLLK